ncbi:MAG: prepilin peptidase [Thermoflavifilum sp.]|nr:prepilin peptidase [Thermoflavifilum sp.]MCL6514499.1 prepilin peptidase [Alicyclobacillus sp.]
MTAADWQSYWMVVAFVMGALIGSFLNVVAYRVPRGESVVRPRSHCPHCGRMLRAWELVPCLSWLWLGGRCRGCGQPVAIRYPILELVTAALFAITVLVVPDWPARVAWMVFWSLLVAVTGTDWVDMRVPDVLSLPGAVIVATLSWLTHWQQLGSELEGAVLCAGLLWVIHRVSGGRMGLGDVKLYLAIGAFLGPVYGLESLIFASLCGVLVGASMRWAKWLEPREPMAFVPHIAVGVVVAALWGPQITAWYSGLAWGG